MASILFIYQDWCVSLGDWIRHNDETILSRSTSVLSTFQEDLLPAQGTQQGGKSQVQKVADPARIR